MTAPTPLQGIDLIECAKANAPLGIETAAKQCGYGNDTDLFQKNLKIACQKIGVNIDQLNDLITQQQTVKEKGGIEIAPDTTSEL